MLVKGASDINDKSFFEINMSEITASVPEISAWIKNVVHFLCDLPNVISMG